MSDEPGFRPETLSTWEPPDDVAAVRQALFHYAGQAPYTPSVRGLDALDRLAAKLKDLEHENREFRPYADALQARVQAAEAREAALRKALKRIASFDSRYGPSDEAEIARAALAAGSEEA